MNTRIMDVLSIIGSTKFSTKFSTKLRIDAHGMRHACHHASYIHMYTAVDVYMIEKNSELAFIHS